jgi:hypothetical protein
MAGCSLLARLLHAETARTASCQFANKNGGENKEAKSGHAVKA